MDKELVYKIGITLINHVGDVNAKKLIAACGGAEAVFKEKMGNLLKIEGIGLETARAIINQREFERAYQEIEFIEKQGIKPIYFLEEDYPRRLRHCADGPVMLYFKGNSNLNNNKVISIVGTRSATSYGLDFCEKLVAELSAYDMLIVSGMAFGIDICAHKACVKNNIATVGVLAHGLDMLYPAQHHQTAAQMIKNGGLLTDFLSGTNPDKENFPKRNRIVAGMSDATIVIEAANKGGALITAELASSYSRDVFALPGRIGDTFSAGCNKLIKINKAAMIESAADLVYVLNWQEEVMKAKKQLSLWFDLSSDEQALVNHLKEKGNLSVDELCYTANINMGKASALLLNLEFKGVVKSLPGKIYALQQ